MTQKQLIELIQQHHPGMGETEIRLALNRAQDDYCAKTELIKEAYTQNSVAGKRYYTLPNDAIKVLDIRCKNHENSKDQYRSIPRATYKPPTEDADGV